jgi:uncharacterized protein (DUF2141 family)
MKRVLTVAAVLAASLLGTAALGATARAGESGCNQMGTSDCSAATMGASASAALLPRLLATAGAPRGSALELRVSVKGLRSSRGVVLIGLYDSAKSFDRAIELSGKDGFLNDPDRVAGAALRINAALQGSVVFSNLEPGRYAIIAIHDENANGRLDKNFFGVPTEPYGFSNDAQAFLGPPSFADAAILVSARGDVAIVDLVSPGDSVAASWDEEDAPLAPPGH